MKNIKHPYDEVISYLFALISHRILDNDKRMSAKEIEEKMHLDETKCCSRKRKRRRRRTLSNSDDDEEDDVSYVPETERPDTPPCRKRKVRKQCSQMVNFLYSNNICCRFLKLN